jgi:hypothetical protein
MAEYMVDEFGINFHTVTFKPQMNKMKFLLVNEWIIGMVLIP